MIVNESPINKSKSDVIKGDVDLITLLKSKLSIGEVLEYYGNIRSSQNNWECTRHSSDNKCSLSVDELKGVCKCVAPGCDLEGNIYNVIGLYENLDTKSEFSLILKKGCELAGIDYELYQIGNPVKIKKRDYTKKS